MPSKKTSAKRDRETECPSSVATEPSTVPGCCEGACPMENAPEAEPGCCEGVCPMKDAPEAAPGCCDGASPMEDVPEQDPVAAQVEPTGADVLENETEIVVEEKPAKKPRKTTKKKDEGEKKPPKPPNAYMLFYQEELKKDVYTGITLPERAKMIGALWRQMDDTARLPFQERVAKAKEALTSGA